MSEPPPEEPYELEGTQPAWEPETLPPHGLTAELAAPLIAKQVGLPITITITITRSIMPKELSEADLADYKVTYRQPGQGRKTVRAAYVTADPAMPGMLAFKDHEHRTVTLIAQDEVLSVDRLDGPEEEMPKAIAEGFRPTSQLMAGM